MRNWSKDTLVRNALMSALMSKSTLVKEFDVEWLNTGFEKVIKLNKKNVEENQRLLKKWEELYNEYLKNKKEFVKKYYNKNRTYLLKIAKRYPITYGVLVMLLDKLLSEK